MSHALARLMLVTDRRRVGGRDPLETVCEALQGGVRLVQVRERGLADAELEEMLLAIRRSAPAGTTLVVNGHAALARAHGVGLHLPARAAAEPAQDIAPRGRSVHDARELRAALAERVDYVVVGTAFATSSEPAHAGGGVEHVQALAERARPVPAFAIGGVTLARVPELLRAGLYGVAVSSAILEADDPRRAARRLVEALH